MVAISSALAGCKMDWQPLCSPRNCPGCCNGTICELGITPTACGQGGNDCSSCGVHGQCALNLCLACTPQCNGKICGDDGCGGSCGSCPQGTACDASQTCAVCTPDCTGKVCGTDGCGGTCGACSGAQTCNGRGQCVTSSCTPDCTGKVCGTDGCGGTCGTCSMGNACDATGQCTATCTPQCSGKVCGTDGCGGTCGQCGSGTTCNNLGQCACVPSCAGKVCGDDGCGGSCGGCSGGDVCNSSGQCVSTCTPSCAGKVCGTDGCGGSCGACGSGLACNASGACVCTPQCTGRQCGSDGCGGSCGSCGAGYACNNLAQCQCVPACAGAQCGADGCGGSCGSCPSGSACNANGACITTSTALTFKTTWQTLSAIGGHNVQFRCAGTVTATASGGTRCELSTGDPVQLSIDGYVYSLYPGCDGYRTTNCMTSLDPTSAAYKDDEVNAGGRLLCDAMGWPLLNTLADKNPGTNSRPVAIVQATPSITGTDTAVKNYGTYVDCEP
ncbi:MAG: hypothetical protein QM723_13310 [Myxococcaceae bacterium]